MLKDVIRLLRPKQWAKNLLVFAAWLFAGRYSVPADTIRVLFAFLAMVLASSAVYLVNDVLDAERDKAHPRKRHRPIASGRVSKPVALSLALALLLASFAVAFGLNRTSLALLGVYLLLQLAYNLRWKAVPVLDVFVIATGFVVRAVLGAAAIAVPISPWFLLCTGALSLMLGFAKRRSEFLVNANGGADHRASLAHYSRPALDAIVVFCASCATMCYGIYTLLSSAARAHPGLILTAPFVFYGVTRYLLLVFRQEEGGEPADLLFGDWHIGGSVVLFVVSAGAALAGLKLPFLEP